MLLVVGQQPHAWHLHECQGSQTKQDNITRQKKTTAALISSSVRVCLVKLKEICAHLLPGHRRLPQLRGNKQSFSRKALSDPCALKAHGLCSNSL